MHSSIYSRAGGGARLGMRVRQRYSGAALVTRPAVRTYVRIRDDDNVWVGLRNVLRQP